MNENSDRKARPYSEDDLGLNAEGFFNDIIGLLAENLEGTIGLENSASFVAAVGGQMGTRISGQYSEAASASEEERIEADIANICVDLKARIGGDFDIESVERASITLVNRRCPFGARVLGRPSLCMMTTNVFGRVAADRNGYAAVHIEKAIATGDPGCRVVISLERSQHAPGHEFFK